MPYQTVESDEHFMPLLTAAGDKLVIVDFFATWCGPCNRIAPVFQQLSDTYPQAVFLKVDVDKCQETAVSYGVSAMPTFVFFRQMSKIDSLSGADPNALQERVRKWADTAVAGEDMTGTLKGQMDINSLINFRECDCLNVTDDGDLTKLLKKESNAKLTSDCDEQILISLAFQQNVRMHSLRISGPPENAPRSVRLFINQPVAMDFDRAQSSVPTQALDLSLDDVSKPDAIIPLQYVKFQNVQNVTIFIETNQSGEEITILTQLRLFGNPLLTTNMSEFKRVTGKKGEAE